MTFKAHFDGKVFVPDEPLHLAPGQPVIIRVVEASAEDATVTNQGGGTARDLLNSPLVGIWKDRTDIGDSVEFARELRRRSERRTDSSSSSE
jgi:hypothetical protein